MDTDWMSIQAQEITGAFAEMVGFMTGTPTTWTTREGKKVRIRGMADKHLLNTIRMLQRNAKYLWEKYLVQCLSMAVLGEMAQEEVESAIFFHADQRTWSDLLIEDKVYCALMDEAVRRKLCEWDDDLDVAQRRIEKEIGVPLQTLLHRVRA